MKKTETYLLFGGTLAFALVLAYAINSLSKEITSDDMKANVPEISAKTVAAQNTKPVDKVQVYLFHSTNRCHSCVTIGQWAKKTIEDKFPEDLKAGKIEFKEINIDLPQNKEVANKFKAAGSSLFINPIIDGKDNIQEDTQVWRLVSNEQAFLTYFSDKLKGLLGASVAAQVKETKKESSIIFFYGDGCPHCSDVEKYFQENKVTSKVRFEKKEIFKNNANAKLLAEKAKDCEMDDMEIGVPFLWADGRCYMGAEDIIEFFNPKL